MSDQSSTAINHNPEWAVTEPQTAATTWADEAERLRHVISVTLGELRAAATSDDLDECRDWVDSAVACLRIGIGGST